MRDYSSRLTSIAIITALLIVGGGFIYTASYILGSSQILEITLISLYFSTLLYLLLVRCPHVGTTSVISLILGVILSVFNTDLLLIMTMTGVIFDIVNYIIFRGYGPGRMLIITVAFYPLLTVIVAFLLSKSAAHFIKNNSLFFSIGAFAIGILGGFFGSYLDSKYIHVDKLEKVI
jgi:hypothetical protein